jgi:hypothetical protein
VTCRLLVDGHVGQALALGGVSIPGDDSNARVHRPVDGRKKRRRIVAGQADAVHALDDEVIDDLRLSRRVGRCGANPAERHTLELSHTILGPARVISKTGLLRALGTKASEMASCARTTRGRNSVAVMPPSAMVTPPLRTDLRLSRVVSVMSSSLVWW